MSIVVNQCCPNQCPSIGKFCWRNKCLPKDITVILVVVVDLCSCLPAIVAKCMQKQLPIGRRRWSLAIVVVAGSQRQISHSVSGWIADWNGWLVSYWVAAIRPLRGFAWFGFAFCFVFVPFPMNGNGFDIVLN